jgi:hypothetical protein
LTVSNYPADTEVQSFASKAVCAKRGARGRHIDVRPNWKEQPPQASLREAMALSPKHRSPAWRRQLIFDAVFALIFAVVLVTLANILWRLL